MSDEIDAIFRRHAAEESRRKAKRQQYEESRKKWDAVDALLLQIEHPSKVSNQLRDELGREPTESERYVRYADLLIEYCRAVRDAGLAADLPNPQPATDGTRLGLTVVRYAWEGNSRDIVSIINNVEETKDGQLGGGMFRAMMDLLRRLRGLPASDPGDWAETDSVAAGAAEGIGTDLSPIEAGEVDGNEALTEDLPATLESLLSWMSSRVQWLRSWHLANDPKPIPTPFLEAMVRLFRGDPGIIPTEPEPRRCWANERIWRFSQITLHQTHACLENLRIYDNPVLRPINPLTDENCLVEALDQLTALRSFVARRVGTSTKTTLDREQFISEAGQLPPCPPGRGGDGSQVGPLSPPATLTNVSIARAIKLKRSTERGEAREKIIAGLTEHHQYSGDSCLNTEPIGVGELAKKARVIKSTVSLFFKSEFKGHDQYRAVCRDVSNLVASLKMLRGEYSPHILYGRTPPGEGDHDDE